MDIDANRGHRGLGSERRWIHEPAHERFRRVHEGAGDVGAPTEFAEAGTHVAASRGNSRNAVTRAAFVSNEDGATPVRVTAAQRGLDAARSIAGQLRRQGERGKPTCGPSSNS